MRSRSGLGMRAQERKAKKERPGTRARTRVRTQESAVFKACVSNKKLAFNPNLLEVESVR